jgi:hypothetical protein
MRKPVCLIVTLLFASSLSPAAWAQATAEHYTAAELTDKGASPEFQAWLAGKGKDRKPAIERNLREQIERRPAECKDVSFGTGWALGIFLPPVFGADGSLDSGVWREGYDVTVCGVKRQLNIVFIAKDGVLKLAAGLPGSSIADPILQSDTSPAFYGKRGNCEQYFALDTRFIGYTGPAVEAQPGEPSRAWREDWTLWACGKEITVSYTFTPDATGTQWEMASPAAKP